jgi:hydroxymethylpyrimidine pyrophosphatase-like HAD family hydrolase
MTEGMSDLIEYSTAKKIFIVNNNDDSDMRGIDSGKMIDIVSKYVNLEDFSFLFNSDANDIMKMKKLPSKNIFNCLSAPMENINGRHDPEKLATEIFVLYFDNEHNYFDDILKSKLSIIYSDFDDTIYARDENLKSVSYDNLELFKELSNHLKCVIVSGNSYEHLNEKSKPVYGEDFEDINCDIYAASIVKYKNGKIPFLHFDYKNYGVSDIGKVLDFLYDHNIAYIDFRPNVSFPICITIKGLTEKKRRKLVGKFKDSNIAPSNSYLISGKTSIDIKNKCVDKSLITQEYVQSNKLNSLCITDILDVDKDMKLMEACKFRIVVKNAIETKIILTLLMGEINGI